MTMERARPAGVVPFEVWDLVLEDGTTLGERFYESDAARGLRQALELLHEGRGRTRSSGPVPDAVAGFDAVYLTGGRARPERFAAELEAFPCPVFFAREGVFGGALGGFELLRERGLTGWVLDVGQSQIKLSTPGHHQAHPRDSTRLRAAGEVSPGELPGQRRRLSEFIALKLQLARAQAAEWPEALVCGLPCPVGDDATPRGGSYAGMRGYRNLLPDALALAEMEGVRLLVLNDAELAAVGVRTDPRLEAARKILLLSLGFGIGAAVVQARARPLID